MKDGVTNVIDTFTQEDFHATFQNLLEQYNIAAGGDYFEGDYYEKKSGNSFNDSHMLNIGLMCFKLSLCFWSDIFLCICLTHFGSSKLNAVFWDSFDLLNTFGHSLWRRLIHSYSCITRITEINRICYR